MPSFEDKLRSIVHKASSREEAIEKLMRLSPPGHSEKIRYEEAEMIVDAVEYDDALSKKEHDISKKNKHVRMA